MGRILSLALALGCFAFVLSGPALAAGNEAGLDGRAQEICQALERFQENVELLRQAMKGEKAPAKEFPAENPDYRDVYDIALTLYGKTDKLAYEKTATRGEFFSNVDVAAITPGDIAALVDNAGKRLAPVLAKYGLSPAPLPPPDAATTATAVYRRAVAVNKQLNKLLDNKTTPADIYRQITWAINYSREILGLFPEASIPALPPLRQGKTPADIYTALIHIFRVVADISRTSGFSAIEIPYAVLDDVTQLTIDDVYDLATVVASQLAFLRSKLKNKSLLPGVYYPGPKTLDDDYQLAGQLKASVDEAYFNIVDDSWIK